jgi:hypothetical protein
MKIRRNNKNGTLSLTITRDELRLLHGSVHQNVLAHRAYVGEDSALLPALLEMLATLESV